jgi:hypothetical protein
MLRPWTCHCGQANLGPSPCSACLNAAPPSVVAEAAVIVPARRDPLGPARTPLTIATVVLLAGGLLAAAFVRAPSPSPEGPGGDGALAGRTVEVAPDTVPGPGATDLERALPELLRFVQDARGLPFRRPVEVTLLDDDAFRKRLLGEEMKQSKEDAEKLLTTQRVLQGLGLLDKDVDLSKAVRSLYGAAVAGFYDTETDDLVVRGEHLSPSIRTTLVHELTHALQDQHFDIDRKDFDDRDDEAADGLQGIVEGDAVRIERLYQDTLSDAERKQAEQEELVAGAGIDPDLPPVLLQLVAFPYLVGPEFTTDVVRRAGQARLDQAFADPPTTTEALLHPDRFVSGAGVAPLPVDDPHPAGKAKAIDQGVLGELGLLLVLNASGVSGRAAADGWGGDRYVAWRDGDDTCVRVTVAMDSPADTTELRAALGRLQRSRDGVAVTGPAAGPVTFTSCR